MDQRLQSLTDRYLEAYGILASTFENDSRKLYPPSAVLLAGNTRSIGGVNIASAYTLLKSNENLLSSFRGDAKILIVTAMAMSQDPMAFLTKTQKMFAVLRNYFEESKYTVVAAMALAQTFSVSDAERLAERGSRLFALMKEAHPEITLKEDTVFSVLLANSGKTDDELIADMEECFRYLKDHLAFLANDNTIQTASQTLAFSSMDSEAKTSRLLELQSHLKHHGFSYCGDYELSTLAALATLSLDITAIESDLVEITSYLSRRKPYVSLFGFSKEQRLMHAGMLVLEANRQESGTISSEAASPDAPLSMEQFLIYMIIMTSMYR